jgi:type I restriction enzyme, S subunit
MIGEGKTRGQPAILSISASNNQNSAAIRVSETPISPEFVYSFLSYRYEKTRRAGQGGNQPALNLGKVSRIRMPVPPLIEMAEIVGLVSNFSDVLSDVTLGVDMAGKDVFALRQSVLKSAFEGKLVAQDPRDEPADVMLARLNPPDQTPRKAKARR